MTPEDPLRLSPLLQASAGEVLEAVRKLGLEGVVWKRIDSTYEPGERSGAWIKPRTNLEQEFVIGGYIPGARGFARRRLREETTHLRRKVKNGKNPLVIPLKPFILTYGQWLVRNGRSETLV